MWKSENYRERSKDNQGYDYVAHSTLLLKPCAVSRLFGD